MLALPVLFVDDSAVARAATKKRLEHRGIAVTVLASAREAEGAEGLAFAAALLDLDLGDGYGPDIAARLRAQAPELPIAFLTAGEGPQAVMAAARALGPVFPKTPRIDEAVAWLMTVTRLDEA